VAWHRLVQIAHPPTQPQHPRRSIVLPPGQRRPWELSPSPVPSKSSSKLSSKLSSESSSQSSSQSFGQSFGQPFGQSFGQPSSSLSNSDEEPFTNDETDGQIPQDPTPDRAIPPLTLIQRACLDFCIELLNQRVVHREYDCALMCAMAVLGVRNQGG
jgi:hypothetical protein